MAAATAAGRLLLAAAALILAAASSGVTLAAAQAKSEADVLSEFRATLRGPDPDGGPPAELNQWATGGAPCDGNATSWPRVRRCVDGRVVVLQLEGLRLQGAAPDLALLAPLRSLRSLSLSNNSLAGAFPDVSPLPALRFLFLWQNRLAGEIPDGAFAALRGLQRVDLSGNEFSGPIPSSIASSARLLSVNLANNNFSGPVPEGLRRLGANVQLQGNKFLCGDMVGTPCPPAPPSSSSASSSGGMKVLITIAIVVIAVGAVLAVAGVIAAVRARCNEPCYSGGIETLGDSPDAAKVKVTSAPAVKIEKHGGATPAAGKRGGRRDDHGKLVFIQEGRARFGLEDLLRASAEVLGSGNFGASYKATLLDGPALVVKRFKDMNGAGREDFSEHMRRLGLLVHPNLLPVIAYLYKKEEKLLVTDYMANGSLAHALHGGTRSSLPPLDWPKRLKIIKGVARGLAHLYEELPMLMVPHGHLKSSNVLLDATCEPLLSDYALAPVVTPQHAAQVMVAYKSPECAAQGGRPGRKSDVWSLGILILEVLTGKFPANYLRRGHADTDLAGWVNSVVREEWTGEVFDKDMRGTRSGEGEMVKLLQVGLGCCEPDVHRRWGLEEALARIEELRERDTGADDSSTASSFLSDGEAAASRPAGEQQSHSA
uniref:Protein kinase domain-containing protein n=1 Tax=Zea mays TaxID=4577 RepID=A0A804R6B0_MAIZE